MCIAGLVPERRSRLREDDDWSGYLLFWARAKQKKRDNSRQAFRPVRPRESRPRHTSGLYYHLEKENPRTGLLGRYGSTRQLNIIPYYLRPSPEEKQGAVSEGDVRRWMIHDIIHLCHDTIQQRHNTQHDTTHMQPPLDRSPSTRY